MFETLIEIYAAHIADNIHNSPELSITLTRHLLTHMRTLTGKVSYHLYTDATPYRFNAVEPLFTFLKNTQFTTNVYLDFWYTDSPNWENFATFTQDMIPTSPTGRPVIEVLTYYDNDIPTTAKHEVYTIPF